MASSMGTPIVGLAYNGKFNGLFELLRLPYQPLWLDELKASSFSEQLQSLAIKAVEHQSHLRTRTKELAAAVRQETQELLQAAA